MFYRQLQWIQLTVAFHGNHVYNGPVRNDSCDLAVLVADMNSGALIAHNGYTSISKISTISSIAEIYLPVCLRLSAVTQIDSSQSDLICVITLIDYAVSRVLM